MNHNKIYVYNNDTQRNVSMRHAATISLLNLYPKVPGTFFARENTCIVLANSLQRRKKNKNTTYLCQHWHTRGGVDFSSPRWKNVHDDEPARVYVVNTLLVWQVTKIHPNTARRTYRTCTNNTSCRSALLPFKQPSSSPSSSPPPSLLRATSTISSLAVPTTWETQSTIAYRFHAC